MAAKKRGKPRKVDTKTALIMTLMILRLGLPNNAAAVLFGVSTTTVSSLFTSVVSLLCDFSLVILKRFRPSEEQWKKLTPKEFQQALKSDRVYCTIDCTGIQTEAPANMQANSATYSDYYSFNGGNVTELTCLVFVADLGLQASTSLPSRHAECSCGSPMSSQERFVSSRTSDLTFISSLWHRPVTRTSLNSQISSSGFHRSSMCVPTRGSSSESSSLSAQLVCLFRRNAGKGSISAA